ncbi:MAG: radical SAM protein, partial [Synechococcaceae cyanobacterium]|nr:radical SAM protein [Synechococcaceae cyanobacterium]
LASFDEVLALLQQQDPASLDLHLNGHGETTIHPHWLPFAQKVLSLGFRPQLITNLARPLRDEEVEVLAGFSVICVSLDTVNAELLGRMRRGVALEDLERNLRRIRAAGAVHPPAFRLSCGVYDQTARDLERLGPFCAEHGVGAITFWQLVKYPDLPDALNARPIPALPEPERSACVQAFERAVASLQARGVVVDVAGGFLEEWKRDLAPA